MHQLKKVHQSSKMCQMADAPACITLYPIRGIAINETMAKGVVMARFEKKDLAKKSEVHEQPRKPYTTPKLVRHGDLEELTHGAGLSKGGRDIVSLFNL